MWVTLHEAATLMGKTPRQVRYLILQERLAADKRSGRWMIRREDLPLSKGAEAAATRKADTLHDTVQRTLAEAGHAREAFGIQQIQAVRALLPVHRAMVAELGTERSATVCTHAAPWAARAIGGGAPVRWNDRCRHHVPSAGGAGRLLHERV